MKMKSFFLSGLMSLFALPLVVNASEATSANACKDEVRKLCPNLKLNSGLGKCVLSHRSEFSPGCQERMKQGRTQVKEAMTACQADAQKFCTGMKPGKGDIVKCLQAHSSEISPACKEKSDAVRALVQEFDG